MMRAQGPIDAPPVDVRRLIQYRPMRNQWDLNCDEQKILKKVGANAFVIYKKTMKKFVIAPREFVANQIMNVEANGAISILGSSTNCKFDVPARSGVIRGESPISGYIIEPANQEMTKSYVYVVNEID